MQTANIVCQPMLATKSNYCPSSTKKKKRYEKQLQKIGGTISTIEFQTETLENAITSTEVLKVMRTAGQAQKGAHPNLDVDQVQKIMDEIVNEVSEAHVAPVEFEHDYDEDELNKELEKLVEEELASKVVGIDESTGLPSVPTSSLPAARTTTTATAEEDDEMAELSAWAAASFTIIRFFRDLTIVVILSNY
ncbi:chmp4b [Bugula neritina]|uniref:Chmp4b n=1 Tax=Bugula neritina TaxID=10212 RepID=A0A7J7KH58_BUGNE|nr:chmp4b [Bugula neritina]